MKNSLKYFLCSSGVLVIILAAIFLPEYISRFQDEKYLNTVTLQERDKISLSYHYDTTLVEKMQILNFASMAGKEFKPVLQSDKNVISEEKLVEGVTNEMSKLINYGVVMDNLGYDYQEHFQYAELYSVSGSDTDNPEDTVLFWLINFSDNNMFDYSFCVDAYTYTIYDVKLTGYEVLKEMEYNNINISLDEIMEENKFRGERLAYGLGKYYGASTSNCTTNEEVMNADAYIDLNLSGTRITVLQTYWGATDMLMGMPTMEIGLHSIQKWRQEQFFSSDSNMMQK